MRFCWFSFLPINKFHKMELINWLVKSSWPFLTTSSPLAHPVDIRRISTGGIYKFPAQVWFYLTAIMVFLPWRGRQKEWRGLRRSSLRTCRSAAPPAARRPTGHGSRVAWEYIKSFQGLKLPSNPDRRVYVWVNKLANLKKKPCRCRQCIIIMIEWRRKWAKSEGRCRLRGIKASIDKS